MPTPQQLLAQAGRKPPQDLSRANAATSTLQGAHGGTQQLGAPAQRRLAQQTGGGLPPGASYGIGENQPLSPGALSGLQQLAGGYAPPPQPSEELQSLTGGGLQAGQAGSPREVLDGLIANNPSGQMSPDAGFRGLPGFKPLNAQPLGVALPAPDSPGAAMGARMPPGAGKFPPQGGNPAAGWSVGGSPAPGGGPDVRPPGLPGFKPAGGMLSKPVAPGLPGGDPPLSPDGFGGGKPRQLPFRRNGATDVGRNSMAGF